MKLRIAWWNTRLAPPGGEQEKRLEHLIATASMIKHMIEDLGVDIICLGEINRTYTGQIANLLEDEELELIDFDDRVGHVTFNMAIIVKRGQAILTVAGHVYGVDAYGGDQSRVSLRLKLLLADRTALNLFVVHWPSRRLQPEEADKRGNIAQSLRRAIDDLLEEDSLSKVVILGDFNDEPFNRSISYYLMATRDVAMAVKFPRLLYNPFWRHLSSRYAVNTAPSAGLGSYYYSSDKIHRWRVFDQMIFSSSFLGGSDWHLNEQETMIYDFRDKLGAGLDEKCHFDHYPVIGQIEKEVLGQ